MKILENEVVSFGFVFWAVVIVVSSSVRSVSAAKATEPFDGSENGPLDRFWKYHSIKKSLIDPQTGLDQYQNILSCLQEKIGHLDYLISNDQRRIGLMLREPEEDKNVYAVIVKNAFLDSHVLAVQELARCVRTHLPHLYESRAMYQEMNLDQDDGHGGNCPTHLGSLVPLFLPQVRSAMQNVLVDAYEAAGWKEIHDRETNDKEYYHHEILPLPEQIGVRASEHLTYRDFPQLAEHTDGSTAFTMNYAFSGPEDYQGGFFFIIEETGKYKKRFLKPGKNDAIVFLGGRYLHGVSKITGGHREMFSTEFWPYPDLPFGRNLWTAIPENIEDYVRQCNQVQMPPYEELCTVEFSEKNDHGLSMEEVIQKYGRKINPVVDETASSDSKVNQVHPEPFIPVLLRDPNSGKEYDLEQDFKPDEPDFFVPKSLLPGEMVALRWKSTGAPVDGAQGESFMVGLPHDLLKDFQAFMNKNGVMDVARGILYDEEPLEFGEHRLYHLKDGQNWGAMIQGDWDTDMVWFDPVDEESFEHVLDVLRRGNFDVVLDSIGKTYDLNTLMIQGIGIIFLSEYKISDNIHADLPGSKGSFYNIIVPLHIPENQTATFCIAESNADDRVGTIKLTPHVGLVVGGESAHGTGACSYRATKDFRMSLAIYMADITEDNLELVASDTTSLWPTEGDTQWIWAQRGRLWSKDGSKSLKNDKGRYPLHVEDEHEKCPEWKNLCASDPTGIRLKCPNTCKVYMEDDAYYELLRNMTGVAAKLQDFQVSNTIETS